MLTATLFVLLSFLLAASGGTEVDSRKCELQINFLMQSLSRQESWAIRWYDAWTKLQAGVSAGNLVDFGHFDQCREFRHEVTAADIGTIEGKHCMVFYRATSSADSRQLANGTFDWHRIGSLVRDRNLRLGAGTCMPAVCSSQDIRRFVNETVLAPAGFAITSDYDQDRFCSTKHSAPPLITLDIVAIVVLVALALLLLSSTFHELLMLRSNKRPHELYSAFSLYKNGKKLFSLKREESPNVIQCLPGLRTLSMLHIMLGHRYEIQKNFPNINSEYFDIPNGAWYSTYWSSVISIYSIAVDCFLVLGGCLLARSVLSAIERKNLSIPKLYVHRYFRTTPVLAFLILMVLSLYKFMGNGPYLDYELYYWKRLSCEHNYWAALVHVQNYYKPQDACIPVSWYLSVDFQLVLLSPLILYPAYRFGWKFLWTLPAYIVGSQIWSFIAAWQKGFMAVRYFTPNEVSDDLSTGFYYPTHIRCGPWLTGVILGYILFKLKNRKIALNKHLSAILWILSISTLIALILGIYVLQQPQSFDNRLGNSLFFALQRNSWALAMAWIVFACHMGEGGVLKKFLELPLWMPLGRMSLSFYLVHTLYHSVHLGSIKAPLNFDDFTLMTVFGSDILVTTLLATILYLAVEEPVLLVENYFYKRLEQKITKSSQ